MKKIISLLLLLFLNNLIFSQDIIGFWDGILKGPTFEERVVVKIFKNNKDKLRAYFDSPYNSVFQVPIEKIKFKNNKFDATIKTYYGSCSGYYNKETDEIIGTWKQYKKEYPVKLKRIEEKSIDYLKPRIDDFGKQILTYKYEKPEKISDGWICSTLGDEGINYKNIEDLIVNILNEKHPNIHSVLIVRGGKLVLEEYFYGFNKNVSHPLASCTKAITSVLTGLAIDNQFIKDTEQKLYPFFPEYKNIKNRDDRKKDITIRNLLTMTSGFGSKSGKNFWQSKDWLKFILDLPIAYDPGTKYIYDGLNTMALDAVIEKTSNMKIREFANKYLYNPLKIEANNWIMSPKGRTFTGHGHNMKPRDMAKIGYLILYKGKWKNEQIISKEWIEESTRPYLELNHFSGLMNGKYCYYWLRETRTFDNKEIDIIFGMGNGEQYILVIPAYDMIMVMTGGNYWEKGDPNRPFEFIHKYISKSVK